LPTLEWIGKDKVINHHLDVPYRVLSHQYTYVGGGSGGVEAPDGNKIIRGDNLAALKALLPQYEGRIKLIIGKSIKN
jgi:adenine-specific DNA-methyltransferase